MERTSKVKIEYDDMCQSESQSSNKNRLDWVRSSVCDDSCRDKEFIHDRDIVDDNDYYGVHLSDLGLLKPLCPNSKYWDYIDWVNSKHNEKNPLKYPLYQGTCSQDDYHFPKVFNPMSYAIIRIKGDVARGKKSVLKLGLRWLLYAWLIWCVGWFLYGLVLSL